MMLSCDVCKGRKLIMGLGNINKDCPACKGIGWIEIPEDNLKITLGDIMEHSKARRKKKKTIEPVLHCQ